jgi:hypothetical protein
MSSDDVNDMGYDWRAAEIDLMGGIDDAVPHSARIWDYWLGGKENYRIDQQAGEQFTAIYPRIADTAYACRYFTSRVVQHLASERGVSQFLDIGPGMPRTDIHEADSVHQIAQRVNPKAHVVYVDNDPLTLAYARALLTAKPPGRVDVINGDLADPDTIMHTAGARLDLRKPVAVLLMSVMRHISISGATDSTARSIVRRLRDKLPAGGYLAVCDITDTDDALSEAVRLYNATGAAPWHLRSPAQITALWDGLDLLHPGVVPVPQWRPDLAPLGEPPRVDAWGGLGGWS